MNTIMVTGIKSISQQQVSAMGLNGISAATVSQMPSQEVPVKRSTASDTRRVSVELIDSQLKICRVLDLLMIAKNYGRIFYSLRY